MTFAPSAAAATMPGMSHHACAATARPRAAASQAGPQPSVTAAMPSGAPALGASLIGGGGSSQGLATIPAAPLPQAGSAITAPTAVSDQTGATIALLTQLTATVAAAIGAATLGGGVPTPAPSAPATALDTSMIAPGPLPGTTNLTAALGPVGARTAASVPAGAAAAPIGAARLTTVAPGGSQQDADLVERALGVLRHSASGAMIVDRMLAVGAKINVISDGEFAAMGHETAHAFYDPKIDTMFLRRSDLGDPAKVQFAAMALAHEGTHLLDDVGGIAEGFTRELTARVVAAGGLHGAAGREARDQGLFELMMIKEARAFVFAGTVGRELGVRMPAADPTSVAIAGANDQATYVAVWQRLLQSSYNEQGRHAHPRWL
jgi:hypothetical protein